MQFGLAYALYTGKTLRHKRLMCSAVQGQSTVCVQDRICFCCLVQHLRAIPGLNVLYFKYFSIPYQKFSLNMVLCYRRITPGYIRLLQVCFLQRSLILFVPGSEIKIIYYAKVKLLVQCPLRLLKM